MKNQRKRIERLVSPQIKSLLNTFGGIVIEGPKWCGKTYQGVLFSKSHCYIQENYNQYKEIIDYDIRKSVIFNGEFPRLIDEWQMLPSIWDKVRFIIDSNLNESGQFILTGSTNANRNKIFHSGAGRLASIKMSTLTVFEILNNQEDEFISLNDLFENTSNFKLIYSKYGLEWIAKHLIKGGWPSIYSQETEVKTNNSVAKNYIETLLNVNENYINLGVKIDVLSDVLKSISRLNSSQINESTILRDFQNQISKNTLYKYINVIEMLYITETLESWSMNVRSKTRITTKPKTYFCDPSIGLSLLNVNSYQHLFNDIRLFGVYFENQVIKDLKVYAQSIGAKLYFYRDQNGFEIDAIIQHSDGRWAPIEIKLTNANEEAINQSAKRLLSLENKIQTDYGLNAKPSFYMIIVGSEYSLKRDDGVMIVPFTVLKP